MCRRWLQQPFCRSGPGKVQFLWVSSTESGTARVVDQGGEASRTGWQGLGSIKVAQGIKQPFSNILAYCLLELCFMQICSAHFVGGKVSPTRTHPDYKPSIFPTAHVRVQTEGDLKRSFKRWQASAVLSEGATATAIGADNDATEPGLADLTDEGEA
jgi:hypothetical protein